MFPKYPRSMRKQGKGLDNVLAAAEAQAGQAFNIAGEMRRYLEAHHDDFTLEQRRLMRHWADLIAGIGTELNKAAIDGKKARVGKLRMSLYGMGLAVSHGGVAVLTGMGEAAGNHYFEEKIQATADAACEIFLIETETLPRLSKADLRQEIPKAMKRVESAVLSFRGANFLTREESRLLTAYDLSVRTAGDLHNVQSMWRALQTALSSEDKYYLRLEEASEELVALIQRFEQDDSGWE